MAAVAGARGNRTAREPPATTQPAQADLGGGQGGSHPPRRPTIKDRLADNLGLLLTALGTFIITSILPSLQGLSRWWLVLAAVLALGMVAATLSLLYAEAPGAKTKRLVGGLALCTLVALAGGWYFQPDPVNHDRAAGLVLLDTSQAMGGSIEGSTRLDAAVHAIRDKQPSWSEQLGLATYGVEDCQDQPPYRLRVPITEVGADKLDKAMTGLRVRGRSNLAAAARHALSELEPFSDQIFRHLMIFAGTDNECPGVDLNEVIQTARKVNVHVEWDVVGLGHPPKVQGGEGVRVFTANTQAELDQIVLQLLVIDPPTREFEALQRFLGTVAGDLNAAIPALEARNVPELTKVRDRLTARIEEGEDRFTSEAGRTGKQECEAVIQHQQGQFDRMKRGLQYLGKVLEFDDTNPGNLNEALKGERAGLLGNWEKAKQEYNKADPELQRLVDHCLDALA
jgi:hypothetical protein